MKPGTLMAITRRHTYMRYLKMVSDFGGFSTVLSCVGADDISALIDLFI